MHRLRERLGKIWEAADDEERAVGQVNALLSDTKAPPWLTRHPEMPEWHLHLASVHDPLWQRMGAEMAMALADLIRVGRAAPAEDLRGARLRGGADGPVAQPVGEVLRHRQLRQPPARGGLSGTPVQRGLVTPRSMFWRYPLGRAKTSISSFVHRRRRLLHGRGFVAVARLATEESGAAPAVRAAAQFE